MLSSAVDIIFELVNYIVMGANYLASASSSLAGPRSRPEAPGIPLRLSGMPGASSCPCFRPRPSFSAG